MHQSSVILASRAWRADAWHMASEPRTVIRVFRVHRLPSSALKFFLDLQRREAGNAGQDCTRSRCATVARSIGQKHWNELPE
jgi:hypothetical protein